MNKSILQSKTAWGAIIAIVAMMFPGLWMVLGIGDDYSAIADKIQSTICFVLVIYGRFKAGGVSITGK